MNAAYICRYASTPPIEVSTFDESKSTLTVETVSAISIEITNRCRDIEVVEVLILETSIY
jgi:hypothetical protein